MNTYVRIQKLIDGEWKNVKGIEQGELRDLHTVSVDCGVGHYRLVTAGPKIPTGDTWEVAIHITGP